MNSDGNAVLYPSQEELAISTTFSFIANGMNESVMQNLKIVGKYNATTRV
jgi:hypothetical protein